MHFSDDVIECDWCKSMFHPQRHWSRFCGPECRKRFHENEVRFPAPEVVRDSDLRSILRPYLRTALLSGGVTADRHGKFSIRLKRKNDDV